jgi:hypothetical protein
MGPSLHYALQLVPLLPYDLQLVPSLPLCITVGTPVPLFFTVGTLTTSYFTVATLTRLRRQPLDEGLGSYMRSAQEKRKIYIYSFIADLQSDRTLQISIITLHMICEPSQVRSDNHCMRSII